MGDSKEEKTVRVIPFNGAYDEWVDWEARFLSKAFLGGYEDILDDPNIIIPEDYIVEVALLELIVMMKRNYWRGMPWLITALCFV